MESLALPTVGQLVADKYRIEGLLGKGGMAVVFSAHHVLLDRPVAMKFLSPDLPRKEELSERFLTEARAAARVDSPHVARVMDVGTLDNGLPYMVMERLDGCDLEELLVLEKRLPVGDVVDYTLQALQGLAHAHTLGVVHRDLKPANLFLAHQSDGTAIIKILDFGIAKLESANRQTKQNQAVGSPLYMSPEHIRNSQLVDHRTDIWAIGVVMYELLTGRTPFEADGIGETFAAVLERAPKPIRSLRPEVPEGLDLAIMKCLEQAPEDRYADVAQLGRAIAPWGTGACSALVDGIEQTLRQQLRRYSGQAMILRPEANVTVDIHESRAPTLDAHAPTIEARAPTLTAITGDSIPPFRPKRRWKWAVLGLLGTGGIVYGAATAGYIKLPIQKWGWGARAETSSSAAPSASQSVAEVASSAPKAHTSVAPTVSHRPAATAATHTASSAKKHP